MNACKLRYMYQRMSHIMSCNHSFPMYDLRNQLCMTYEINYVWLMKSTMYDSWNQLCMTYEINYVWLMKSSMYDLWNQLCMTHEIKYVWLMKSTMYDSWNQLNACRALSWYIGIELVHQLISYIYKLILFVSTHVIRSHFIYISRFYSCQPM